MLELKDFLILPSVQPYVRQLTDERPGLRLLAGGSFPRPLSSIDPQQQQQPDLEALLPSGRGAIFRILARQMLDARPRGRIIVIARHKDALRVSRRLTRRVDFLPASPKNPEETAEKIAAAAARRPALLVVEEIDNAAVAEAAFRAARTNRVLAQIDTVFHGSAVIQDLCDLGLPLSPLETLQWIVSVRRQPMLCTHCKVPASQAPSAQLLEAIRRQYPHLQLDPRPTYYEAAGCDKCEDSGRLDHVSAFDLFHNQGYETTGLQYQPSVLPLEEYMCQLAVAGYIPLEDLLNMQAADLRRAYHQMRHDQDRLKQTDQALQSKMVELEAANRVLRHRTEALISLQEVSQALIAGDEPGDLALRITRHTAALCGADRAVLYVLQDDQTASGTPSGVVLASYGWDPERVPDEVPAARLELPDDPQATGAVQGGGVPVPYDKWPPGIEPRAADVEGVHLYAGLRLPLLAQGRPVGLLVVHATRQHSFAPGDVALLHSFANQAALALQRANLIDQLRAKIAALEAAQAGLAQKERMERELELARQVQQSVLPRVVPQIPGFRFAMLNEPARQVGGDFYDVIALDDDEFAIAIADVSDKGMPAALYMALSRSLLLCEARLSRRPLDVIYSVNELLLELGRPNMFVTVFFGLVNRRTRELRYVRAGHDYPLLLRGDQISELHGRGMALGLMSINAAGSSGDPLSNRYSEETVTLQPGDRLVLYTDGLCDALSPEQEFFSRERLGRLLQSQADLPLDDLCQNTFQTLHDFRADMPQFDDMTMLVVEVEPA